MGRGGVIDEDALTVAMEQEAAKEDDGELHRSFADLLGPDCVIKRVDKDRKVYGVAKPEEMEAVMMTRAAAQKRLGACADHVRTMGRQEKIDWALDLKDRANEFYLANNFEEAAKLYTDCLVALDFEGSEADMAEFATRLQLPVCTNLAACMIEMGCYERVIEICDLALSVDPQNAKAMYRRGLASYRLGHHAASRPDLEAALRQIEEELAAGGEDLDEEERRSLVDVKRRVVVYLGHIRQYSAKEKQSCKKMFVAPLYADRPDAPVHEEYGPIDDSDEAIEAALNRIQGRWWQCCRCVRRGAKVKQS